MAEPEEAKPGNPERIKFRKKRPVCTELLILAICETIEASNFFLVACDLHGVRPRTAYHWRRLGKMNPESIHGTFLHMTIASERKAEASSVALVKRHAETDPATARWILERKFHQRWASHVGEFGKMKRRLKELEREIIKLGIDVDED